MLLDVLDELGPEQPDWAAMREPVLARARRFAAVQERLIAPDGTFPPIGRSIAYRAGGWLTIGLAGHQPGIGERYISTGSLYLCTTAFLPLGLAAADPFWSDPARPWTSRLAWSGAALPIDAAL